MKIGLIFGRFNPPTTGHEFMINYALKHKDIQDCNLYVYISKVQDNKKNPLNCEEKETILNSMFDNNKLKFIRCDQETNTLIKCISFINKEFNELVLFCGKDRLEEYKTLVNKYNGKEYNFKTITILSVGDRDPNSTDIKGMSSSKAREFVINDDFDNFSNCLSSKISLEKKKDIFINIKNNLKIRKNICQVFSKMEKSKMV